MTSRLLHCSFDFLFSNNKSSGKNTKAISNIENYICIKCWGFFFPSTVMWLPVLKPKGDETKSKKKMSFGKHHLHFQDCLISILL